MEEKQQYVQAEETVMNTSILLALAKNSHTFLLKNPSFQGNE